MPLKHSVYDSDSHFLINPITRVLKSGGSTKRVLSQFDHNSERMTFEIPRYIEGHDMSQCDVIQIHFNNIENKTKKQNIGVYKVDDMQISPDSDDTVIFSWLVSNNATQYVGSLNFVIRFACTEGDTVMYAWNTAIYSGISVSAGMNNGDVIAETYPDILLEWENRLNALENSADKVKIIPFSYGSMGTSYYCTTTVPFAEIYQAYQNGMTLVATTATNIYYYLSNISETTVEFVKCYTAGGKVTVDTITLNANNVASFTRDQVSPGKLVTINQVYQMGGYTYSSDTTPSEIYTAFSAGQSITAVLKFSGMVSGVMQMVGCTSVQTVFNRCVQSGDNLIVTTYTIGSDKTVTVSTLTVPTGVKSWAEPAEVEDTYKFTTAGYYYVHLRDTSTSKQFIPLGMVYYKPNMSRPMYVDGDSFYERGLCINLDGTPTVQKVSYHITDSSISVGHSDDTSGDYVVCITRLS